MRHRSLPTIHRSLVALTTLAVAVGVLGVTGSAPASAAVGWRPPAEAVPTAPTYVLMDSQPGDYIGQGRRRAFTQADSDITISLTGPRIDLSIDGDEWWHATFVPPSSVTSLRPGLYEGLTRHPFHDAAVGGLSFYGEGRGCNELTGWYEVDEVVHTGGRPTGFTLRFGQHCEGGGPALHGQIRWDAAAEQPPAPTPVPAEGFWAPEAGSVPATGSYLFLSSSHGDYIGGGQTYLYDPAELSVSAPVRALQLGTVTGPSQPDRWSMYLVASNRATEVEPGLYDDLRRYPFHNPVRGGFRFSGNGRGCNELSADVVVDEIDMRSGVLADVRLRFAQRCELTGPPLFGELRWQPSAPVGAPSEVRDVIVRPDVGGDRLSWPAPDPAESVTGYEITTYLDGTAVATTTAPAGAQSALLPRTAGSGRYGYKVAARNASGRGPRSRMASPRAGIQLGPFADLASLVDRQYLDFVGRMPSPAERADALVAIQSGEETAALVERLALDPTWAGGRAPTTRLYSAYFARLPDVAGLDHWTAQLRSGTSLGQVSSLFARSAEFRRTYGTLSDAAFVDLVYRNVLGRPADPSGSAYWRGRLASGLARSRLMLLFSESVENAARMAPTVAAVLTYDGMLERMPTAAEVTAWAVGRAGPADIARALLDDEEYRLRVLG